MDHKPLLPFITDGMKIDKLDCWSLELQEYDIEMNYIKGTANVASDIYCIFIAFKADWFVSKSTGKHDHTRDCLQYQRRQIC